MANESRQWYLRASDGKELPPDPKIIRRTLNPAAGAHRRLGLLAGRDHGIVFRDNDTGATVVTAYLLPSGQDSPTEWIAVTPDGYYQGSPGVERYMRWRMGEKLLPGLAFRSWFNQPSVIASRLAPLLK